MAHHLLLTCSLAVSLGIQAQSLAPSATPVALSISEPGSLPREDKAALPLLTLQDALVIAHHHQPDLRLASARVAAAQAQVAEARAAFYPQISLTGIVKAGLPGSTNALGLIGFPATPFYRNIAGSLNIQQSIFDFGRLRHTLGATRFRERAAVLQQTADERTTELLVARAYFLALLAHTQRQIAETQVTRQQLDRREAQAFERSGLRSQYDSKVVATKLARAEFSLLQNQLAENAAKVALRIAMGVDDVTSPVALVAPAPQAVVDQQPADINEAISIAEKRRPELQAEAMEFSALEQQLDVARAGRLPEIDGFGAAGGGRFNGTTVKPQQQHGVAAIGASLPVYDGGMRKARIREAKAELTAEAARRDQLRESIAHDVNDVLQQRSSAVAVLAAAKQEQQLVEEDVRGVSAQASVGLVSTAARERARLNLAEVSDRVTAAQLEADMLRINLAFALGVKIRP
jgi:Outer membrane protein